MTAAQRFNVGFLFLYGTLWEMGSVRRGPDDEEKWRRIVQPAFVSGLTDWHLRCISLPTISKRTEVWSGDIQTSQIEFDLADTDGGASATLYPGSASPMGKPVAFYMKVSENPTYWSAVFSGNIVRSSRSKGLITLTVEDTARNLRNSQFVTDYQCIATKIDGILYGTIKDIIGTNVYIDDKYDQTYITVTHGQDTDWFANVIAGMGFPVVIGAAAGPGGIAAGLLSGALGLLGQPSVGKYEERYIKITDYNVIPDGVIAGGQNFKFYSGSVNSKANGTSGALYYLPSVKSKGGHFENGVFGTIELDDILHDARKGDYIYVEQPITYWGSPDDIIMNMLTGSNVTVRYSYPDDFSEDWVAQTSALKHIECSANVDNFELGGVMEAISKLAEEFGFSFYVDESNKFAVRSVRDISSISSEVVGTMSESYNVIGDGLTLVEDLADTYTDLEIKYRDTFGGKIYEQTVVATMGGATYYGGLKRVKTIQSAWIHDSLTGQYIAKRMARRYATRTFTTEGDISLYSGPFKLGEIVRANGWAVGTNQLYEIISYSKDFNRSRTHVVAENADSIYSGRSYFYLGVGSGNVSATSRSGFGTILAAPISSADEYGVLTILDFTVPWPLGFTESEINVSISDGYKNNMASLVGEYIRIGAGTRDEIMKVISVENLGLATTGFYRFNVKVERGAFDTVVNTYWFDNTIYRVSPKATCFNIGTIYGQCFRWF